MEERKNSKKKMNYKSIYSQVVKYGRSIPELAVEYGMSEQDFVERIRIVLDPKLFSKVTKTSEKIEKQKRKNEKEVAKNKEKRSMLRQNDGIQEVVRKEQKTPEELIKHLENQKADIIRKISDNEKKRDEVSQTLEIYEEDFKEALKVFKEATKKFNEAKYTMVQASKKRKNAIETVKEYTKSIKGFKVSLKDVEAQITELEK